MRFMLDMAKAGPFIGPRGGKWADPRHTIPWKEPTRKRVVIRDQTQSEAFKSWFENSEVVNDEGAPLVVYHGTLSHFTEFGPFSHFGTATAANDRLAVIERERGGDPRILPVYLHIENPLRVHDLGVFSPIDIAGEFEDDLRVKTTEAWVDTLTEEERHRIEVEAFGFVKEDKEPILSHSELMDELMKVSPSSATDIMYGGDAREGRVLGDPGKAFAIVEDALREDGYDGLVYENVIEGTGDSWVTLNPEQVKSSTANRGTFDPDDPSMVKAGPFIGPRGGKWADAKHTIPWKERGGKQLGLFARPAKGLRPETPKAKDLVAAEKLLQQGHSQYLDNVRPTKTVNENLEHVGEALKLIRLGLSKVSQWEPESKFWHKLNDEKGYLEGLEQQLREKQAAIPTKEDAEYAARVVAYEEKQEAKRERYEVRADKAHRESERRLKAGDLREEVSGIPMGQPILVGHHSEKRHRAALKRADRNIRAGIEASKKAEHYERKAKSVGRAGISSDDPAAVVKLKQQIVAAEEKRAEIKKVNRLIRKKGMTPEKLAAEMNYDPAKTKTMMEPDYAGRVGIPSYVLTNLGANIRRMRQRVDTLLEAAATPEAAPVEGKGYRIEENKEDNRIRMFFDEKPSKEARQKLKSAGFRWSPSAGAWQRHLNNAGRYAVERMRKELFPEVEKSMIDNPLFVISLRKARGLPEQTFYILEKAAAVAGPFIGPRGGKWADPQHKIPWQERKERKPAKEKEVTERNWVDHKTSLPAQTIHKYATVVGHDRFGDPIHVYLGQRKELHDKIVKPFIQNKKPLVGKKVAVVMMGGAASGKTSLVKDLLGNKFDSYVNVNPDDVKEKMPEYNTALEFKKEGRMVSAKDAAFMAHEESSDIAQEVYNQALDRGLSVIVDGTGKNGEKHRDKIQALKDEGYEIQLLMPHIDKADAIARVEARAIRTGRFVPNEVVGGQYDRIPGNFEASARMADSFKLFDSSGRPPVVKWSGPPETIHDQAFVDHFKTKGASVPFAKADQVSIRWDKLDADNFIPRKGKRLRYA